MSRARKVRRLVAWARYANHYGHIDSVSIGGWKFIRTLNVGSRRGGGWGHHWGFIRHQAKHRLGETL